MLDTDKIYSSPNQQKGDRMNLQQIYKSQFQSAISRITIFILLLFALALGAGSVQAQPPITGNFTCDNAYAVWVGDDSSVNSLVLQGVNNYIEQIRSGEAVTFNVPNNFQECYLYLITWSDDAVYQGVIGSFTGTVQVDTSDPRWQVLQTKDDIDPQDNAPTAAQINAKINIAATNDAVANGAGGACAQGIWNANSGSVSGEPCWTDPYLGPTNAIHSFPFNAFGSISGVSNNAKWMWYDSTRGQANDGVPYWPAVTLGKTHPFADPDPVARSGGHGEYLIFRIPCRAFFHLNIDKRAINGPWQAGGTGTYQLTVTNNGSEITPGSPIVVNEVNFPTPPLTATSISGNPPSTWSCTQPAGPCTYTGSYPVAANATLPPITINVGIDSSYSGGTVQNCAEVTLQQGGAPIGQDTSCTDIVIQPSEPPHVSIQKQALGTPWQAGGTGTFQITVDVQSAIPANQAIAIQDVIPAGLTLVPGTISPNNLVCSGSTCYLNGPVAAGAFNITFDVQISETCNTYKNCADVDVTDAYIAGAALPEFLSEGQSCVEFNVVNCSACAPAPLHIKKLHSPATFTNGGTGVITIAVSNTGSDPVMAPIQVNDTLPAGLTMPQGPFSPTADIACVAGSILPSPQQVHCAYMGNSDGNFSFSFPVNVNAKTDRICNHAAVIKGCCSEKPNDETRDCISITNKGRGAVGSGNNPAGMLGSITKTHSPHTFSTGGKGTFSIKVKNKSKKLKKGALMLVDHMPEGLSVKTGAFRAGSWSCKGGMVSSSGQDVSCSYNRTLGKHGRATLNLNVRVAQKDQFPAGVDSVENCATASVRGAAGVVIAGPKACDKVKIRKSSKTTNILRNLAPLGGLIMQTPHGGGGGIIKTPGAVR